MLREIRTSRNDTPERTRRWFHSDLSDLFVWSNSNEEIVKFQFTYFQEGEKALTWDNAYGYSHDRVEDERNTAHAASPYLTNEPEFSQDLVFERFESESRDIDATIRETVISRIRSMPSPQTDQQVQISLLDAKLSEKFAPLFHLVGVFILLLAAMVFIAKNGA